MIPDLAWWGRLLGLLAVEAALLVAVAALAARLARRPQLQRVVWQSCLIAVALVWLGELGGLRGQLAKLRPAKPVERTLAVRLVDAPISEPLTEPFPEEPLSPAPAVVTPSRPTWWPGQLWLAGFALLLAKALGSRVWLGWRVRANRTAHVGQAASLPEHSNPTGRLAARPTWPSQRDTSAATAEMVTRLRAVLGLQPVRVQVWPQLRGPVAFGVWRPTVALPADFETRFTPKQREAMLAHELAHLAGRDPLWLALADAVCALAWWHPAVWRARRQLRAASEATADEASALVPDGRVALAEALVSFGRELSTSGGIGGGGSGLKSELARRVNALVSGGSGPAVRPAGRWLLRLGLAGVFGALLLAPWPGIPGGLGVVIAAVQAQQASNATEPSSITAEGAPPVLEAAVPSEPTPERIATDSGPQVPGGLNYELPQSALFHRILGTRVASDQHGTNGGMVIPSFEFPGETLDEAVRRLTAAARKADPEGRGVSVSFFESPGLEAVRIRPGPTLHSAQLTLVLATLAQAAESPIQSSLENNAVVIAASGGQADLDRQARIETVALELRATKLALNEAEARFAADSQELAAAKQRHNFAEAAVLSEAKQNQLAVRRFVVSPTEFRNALTQFLPRGETDFQVAVRAFAAANGVEFPPPVVTDGVAVTPPASQPAIFFDEAKRLLFVRATLADLERIERALQELNLPPVPLANQRAELIQELREKGLTFEEQQRRLENQPPNALDEADRRKQSQPQSVTTTHTPAVMLEIQFAEITEGGGDDIGLDWLFGQSPTNNPVPQTGSLTNLPGQAQPPQGSRLQVERLVTEGQSATLTQAQFDALLGKLKQRHGVDLLAAPKVTTLSGRQAQVAVSEVRTLVTDVKTTPGSRTNKAEVNYQTENVPVGPVVDILPQSEGDGWRLTVTASLTEFLGYDDPGRAGELKVANPGGKPVRGTTPLPRLRVRETQAAPLAKSGETVVLRGPLVSDTVRFKDKVPVLGDIPVLGRPFRSEGKSTVRKRLYVFVTPTRVSATGEKE